MTKTNLNAVKEDAADYLNEKLNSVSEQAKDHLANLSEKAKDGCNVLSESVKQKPLVYLGFALAVGVALGAVFLCRRSD